jgi:GrpB-like predicted nucleotidyltransferase (UPF0157 family)
LTNVARIVIKPYQTAWVEEFAALGRDLRVALGPLALRIDHIGSTAVPGLAAKDRIDIQVTVRDLELAIDAALQGAGYHRVEWIAQDHLPLGYVGPASEWIKWTFVPSGDRRATNVHVRLSGRANQRYALLFRDYLRAFPAATQAYELVKIVLAKHHSADREAYYEVKDPVCDIIIQAAELWAAQINWQPGPSDA